MHCLLCTFLFGQSGGHRKRKPFMAQWNIILTGPRTVVCEYIYFAMSLVS